MNALITGSLAFDHVMNFNGKFSDYILPDKIHQLNLSFAVTSMRKEHGGCAGNIAYNLSLLAEKPILFGVAGEDFGEYKTWLSNGGIDTRFVREMYGESSSIGFGITDSSDNQIWGYYPGAMKYAGDLKIADILEKEVILEPKKPAVSDSSSRFGGGGLAQLTRKRIPLSGIGEKKEKDSQEKSPIKLKREELGLLIIAPNDITAMMNFAHEAKELHLPYIFDPGMQLPNFDSEKLLKAIDGSTILIGNDYEIELIKTSLNADDEMLLHLCETVITTKGSHGSLIMTKSGLIEIPPAHAVDVIDPTGAGDAYRAGIIYGYLHKIPLDVAGRIGSLLAAYTVEAYGTTTHSFKIIEFKKRYQENFKERLYL